VKSYTEYSHLPWRSSMVCFS